MERFPARDWKVESLRIPEEWKHAIFWDNAAPLYDGRVAAIQR